MMALEFLMGTPTKYKQLPIQSASQLALTGQAGQVAQNLLGQASQPFSQSPIAQQARNQYQTQIIPGLAERFTNLGGGQRSSAFQSALGQAGVGLESNLAALGQQNQNQLLQLLLDTALQPQFENLIQPRKAGLFESAGAPLLGGLGQLLPLFLGSGGSNLLNILSLLGRK